jgi:hypothetical protein
MNPPEKLSSFSRRRRNAIKSAATLAALAREPGTVHLRLGGLAEVEVTDHLERCTAPRLVARCVIWPNRPGARDDPGARDLGARHGYGHLAAVLFGG